MEPARTQTSAKHVLSAKRILSSTLRFGWPIPFVIAYVLYITGPALASEFSVLDDHLVPYYLGADGEMTWGETAGVIRAEALTWANRFLPLHFTLRVLEIKWRGFDPWSSHLDRTLLGCLCALSVYAAAACFIRPLGAAALALGSVAGQPAHQFINLGFPETFGSALTLSGAAVLAITIRRGRDRPLQLFPGFLLILLAGACKESFVPLLPAALVIVYGPQLMPGTPMRRPLAWRRRDWAAVIVLLLGTLGLVSATFMLLESHGHQYRAGLTPSRFSHALELIFINGWGDTYWPVAILAALWSIWLSRSRTAVPLGTQVAWLVAALIVGFILLVLPQCVIYGSSPNFFARYLVPGNLFVVFAAALGLWIIGRVSRPVLAARLIAVVSVIMIIAAAVAGTHERAYAIDFAKATHEYRAQLAGVEALKRQHPDWPIVFHAGDLIEFEPILSAARFLSTGPVAGSEMFLLVPHYQRSPNDPLGAKLADQLEHWSEHGGEGFLPLSQLHLRNGECVGAAFPGGIDPRCRDVVGFGGARY